MTDTLVRVDEGGAVREFDGDSQFEREPIRALTVVQQEPGIAASGVLALAALTDDEFSRRLAALEKGAERVSRIQRALMVKDVDYGVIPGTPKPTLLKPGAEKLCLAYSLVADFLPRRTLGDAIEAPAISYLTRCDLHLGSLDGPVVAVGYGAANSWEKRYRWRQGERTCPNCAKVGTVIKGKEEYGGGWLCWPKKGGCNTKWRDGDQAIEGQSIEQVENPDPYDLDVTLAKMAEKRAHVDATLRATAASSLFTQDMEDRPDHVEEPRPPAATPDLRGPDGSLIGTVEIGKGDADFELRQTPDGYVTAFRLVAGRKGIKVVAIDPLASALHLIRDQVLGQRATCWGRVKDESFRTKDNPPRTITYQVLTLERIATADLLLPADEPVNTAAGHEPWGDELDAIAAALP